MFKYVNQELFKVVYVVGCGGTGSRVVSPLSQLLKTIKWLASPTIVLIDDDVVESKNLVRQNFIEPDVGQRKAEVLADRYSNAFDINVCSIPTKSGFLTQNTITNAVGKQVDFACPALVIMCVDSVAARKETLATFTRLLPPTSVVIDAGNGDLFGQVSVSNLGSVIISGDKEVDSALIASISNYERRSLVSKMLSLPDKLQDMYSINYLPLDVLNYGNMVDNEGRSCTDLDQTLAVNNLMAAMILNMVQNIYYQNPIQFSTVSMNLNGASNSQLITPKSFNDRITKIHSFPGMLLKKPDVNSNMESYVFQPSINSKRYLTVYASNKASSDFAKFVSGVNPSGSSSESILMNSLPVFSNVFANETKLTKEMLAFKAKENAKEKPVVKKRVKDKVAAEDDGAPTETTAAA